MGRHDSGLQGPPDVNQLTSLAFLASATDPHMRARRPVSYFLVDDKRRQRIGYADAKAIGYEVFHRTLPLDVGTYETNARVLGETR
jgi:hypothetical protein